MATRHGAHNRVRNVDKLDRKRPQRHLFARFDAIQARPLEQVVLLQAPFHERQRERRAVDGHVHLREQERHATDVVFVPVGEDQAADKRLILFKISEIRGDDVHPVQLGVREHHAGVEHDDVVTVAQRQAVHSELAQAAKGDYLQFVVGHMGDAGGPRNLRLSHAKGLSRRIGPKRSDVQWENQIRRYRNRKTCM